MGFPRSWAWALTIVTAAPLYAGAPSKDALALRNTLNRYHQLSAGCLYRKDIKGWERLKRAYTTPDFSLRSALTGKLITWSDWVASFQRALERGLSLTNETFTIDKISVHGSSADVLEHLSELGTTLDKRGKSHRFDERAVSHSIWVKTTAGWKGKFAEGTLQTFVDGRPIIRTRKPSPH